MMGDLHRNYCKPGGGVGDKKATSDCWCTRSGGSGPGPSATALSRSERSRCASGPEAPKPAATRRTQLQERRATLAAAFDAEPETVMMSCWHWSRSLTSTAVNCTTTRRRSRFTAAIRRPPGRPLQYDGGRLGKNGAVARTTMRNQRRTPFATVHPGVRQVAQARGGGNDLPP